jgi:hypothetical protein
MKKMIGNIMSLARKYRKVFQEIPVPEFLIIGAQKCGTTSLYAYLTQHPGIIAADRKEIHYFGHPENQFRGQNWYLWHFPTNSYRKSLERQLGYPPISGEATPNMNQPFMPKLVHELLPHAKLIAMFRNPIDRAFSQYQHYKKFPGREPLSFEEAIEKSPVEIPPELMNDIKGYAKNQQRSYITRGLYFEQLERWYQYYPKDQIHIISSEEFFADPAIQLKKVLEFLELPDFEFDCSVFKNIGNYESKISDATKERLEAFYRPHNRRLYELTGKNFGWPA